MNKSLDWSLFEEYVGRINDLWETEAWQKVNHHDKTNGLSQKAVNSYRREHPGSKLQTAVTTKPSKLKKGSKAAKRRKSFCARMSGNKGPMKKPNGKPTPKALALRRWNCESIEQMAQMIAKGEQLIAEIKKGQKDSNGFTKCWPGKHAEGTKKGKNGKPVRNCVPNESQGVAEGSDSYTVANDPDKPGMHSYREVGHAVQSGHSDAAKIYKNNKFLGTVGDVRKQGVAEAPHDQEATQKIFKSHDPESIKQWVSDAESQGWAVKSSRTLPSGQIKVIMVKRQGVAEAPHDDEVDYDDKYQAMVKRVGQKAREQQRHEPVDLVKLAQRLRQADKTTDTTDEDVMESRLSAMKRAGYDIL